MVKMPTEEHDATKKATLRGMTAITTEQQTVRPQVKGKGGPSRRRNKGAGKATKAKGEGKNDTSYTWRNGRVKGKGKHRQNTTHPTHWQVNWHNTSNGRENRPNAGEASPAPQTAGENGPTPTAKVKKS